jgi:hypothetical protein
MTRSGSLQRTTRVPPAACRTAQFAFAKFEHKGFDQRQIDVAVIDNQDGMHGFSGLREAIGPELYNAERHETALRPLSVILFFAAFKYSKRIRNGCRLGGLAARSAVSSQAGADPARHRRRHRRTVAQIALGTFPPRQGGQDAVDQLALVVIFGGMTLAFQNEAFIKWKPTILYWVFRPQPGIQRMGS